MEMKAKENLQQPNVHVMHTQIYEQFVSLNLPLEWAKVVPLPAGPRQCMVLWMGPVAARADNGGPKNGQRRGLTYRISNFFDNDKMCDGI
jgi:hypothetical protein